MDIKSWIKAARQHAQLTQAQLGEPLGVGKGNVSAWEKGRHEPSFEQLVRISEITRYSEPLPGLSVVAHSAQLPDPPVKQRPWPFPGISEDEVLALPPAQLSELQGALALAIAQLKHGIRISPVASAPSRPSGEAFRSHKAGGLVDMDAADDAFPMRIQGLEAAPWEGGKTTKQMERENLGLRISHAINVGHVEDSGYSANDQEFVPIPELDVRMAAGKLGIENYEETEIGQILLRRSFLESFKRPIKRMKICYGNGFSMEPVIRHRNPMLVDIHPVELHEVQPRFVYAINRGGEMIVKCLERWKDGTWMAISTNLDPEYHPFPLATDDGREVRIIGTVLWSPYDLRNGVDERLLLGWRQATG